MPSKTKKQLIIEYLEKKGCIDIDIEWVPIGTMMEMQGHEGGWVVKFNHPSFGYDAFVPAHNYKEVIEQIDLLFSLSILA